MMDRIPDRVGWVLAVFALLLAANAIWMLVDPQVWYHELPAAVPDFGPYNEHFVRDIGCAFGAFAFAFAWAARAPAFRYPLVSVSTAFLVAHAALHVFDTARGFVDHSHWWIDLPGVYVPAVASAWLLLACRPELRPPPANPE